MRAPLLAILPLLAITGCSGAAVGTSSDGSPDAPTAVAGSATAVATGRGRAAGGVSSSGGAKAIARSDGLLEFKLSYPAAVGAIPRLASLIEREALEVEAEMRRDAREEQAAAGTDYTFRPHYLSYHWEVVADLPRFLSLSNDIATYTGGAHGMSHTDAIVWDRQAAMSIEPVEMFVSSEALQNALDGRYCPALDKERQERRGPDWKLGNEFDACPPMENLTVLVGSGDGRTFNRLTLYAGPYVAGPYAEGAYEVHLPVDAAVLQAVKPEYRPFFSAG